MKPLLIAATALITFSVPSFAQQSSGTSDREGGHGAATSAPGSVSPGAVKPCGKDKSATSDRGGGKEKTSDSNTNNPAAPSKSGDC